MNKFGMLGILLGVVVLSFAVIYGIGYFSYTNQATILKNTIEAKMTDNQNQYDNMWKQISQISQVAEKDRQTLKDIIVGNSDARTNKTADAAMMNWIKEAVPNVDSKTFTNLQNIISSQRTSWTRNQTELIDLNREYNNLRTLMPSKWFLGGYPEIKITIVTSKKTKTTFVTGEDNDVDVFGK